MRNQEVGKMGVNVVRHAFEYLPTTELDEEDKTNSLNQRIRCSQENTVLRTQNDNDNDMRCR